MSDRGGFARRDHMPLHSSRSGEYQRASAHRWTLRVSGDQERSGYSTRSQRRRKALRCLGWEWVRSFDAQVRPHRILSNSTGFSRSSGQGSFSLLSPIQSSSERKLTFPLLLLVYRFFFSRAASSASRRSHPATPEQVQVGLPEIDSFLNVGDL